MKTYTANIWCAFPGCHAEPWPSDPAVRETFSLLRLGPSGRPAESPAPGEWRCEKHPIAKQDLPAKRAPRVAPTEAVARALTDFENTLAAASARLEEEVGDGGPDDAEVLATFNGEVGRGLAALQKEVRS